MNRQKWILLVTVLALMGGTAAVLARLKANQRLGRPGVTTTPIANDVRVQINLPERVLDFSSQPVETEKAVVEALPADTSFANRVYKAPDGFETALRIVLMGGDRTSIHKPQFCLEGAGWKIDSAASGVTKLRVERPQPYDLGIIKLIATHSREVTVNGQTVHPRAVFVYWFVADDALSADALGFAHMWSMARHLMATGELQRWSYVTCFSICAPGQEDATFERMKKFIAAAVPEFQLTPKPVKTTLAGQ
jgi:hypothetical protein